MSELDRLLQVERKEQAEFLCQNFVASTFLPAFHRQHFFASISLPAYCYQHFSASISLRLVRQSWTGCSSALATTSHRAASPLRNSGRVAGSMLSGLLPQAWRRWTEEAGSSSCTLTFPPRLINGACGHINLQHRMQQLQDAVVKTFSS